MQIICLHVLFILADTVILTEVTTEVMISMQTATHHNPTEPYDSGSIGSSLFAGQKQFTTSTAHGHWFFNPISLKKQLSMLSSGIISEKSLSSILMVNNDRQWLMMVSGWLTMINNTLILHGHYIQSYCLF